MAKKRKPAKPQGAVPPPVCKAILLCDRTILEAGTGKVSVIGIFDGFSVPQFPARVAPFSVFVQLTEGIGRYEIVVEVHDLQEGKILARAAGLGIEFAERLSRINLDIPVPPLPLAHGGKYDLVVLANGQEIDRQQFAAATLRGSNDDSDDVEETEDN